MVAVEVEEGNQSVVREQDIYGQENITEDMRPEASTKKESVLSLKHYSDLFGMCLYCVCACE